MDTRKIRKIRLGRYPYTYARVSAMRSKLIKRDDYNKLMKMKLNEVIKFLEESEYKKEIDELSVKYSGIELLEVSINKNLTRVLEKLKRISTKNLKMVVQSYMNMKDLENLKTIIRAKFTNFKEDEIKRLLIPVGTFTEEQLIELFKKDSVEDVARSLKFLTLEEEIKSFKEKSNLFEIENKLDRYYYNKIIELSRKLPRQGNLLREFLGNEIDVMNLKTMLRLKREGLKADKIKPFIFFANDSGQKLNERRLLRFAEKDELEEMILELKKTKFGKILEEGDDEFKKDRSLIGMETALNKFALNRAILFLHQNPLSFDTILGYMFAKEIETKNLKTVIKGKQLGLDETFILKELVIGRC